MASVFVSSPAEVVVIDSRTRNGTITLPTTNSIPFRVLNFKDQYGTFSNSTFTISTQLGESFDDGTTTKTFSNAFSYLSLYSISSKWMVMNATQTVQQFVSSLTVNQLTFGTGAGWTQFGPVQATVISSIQMNTNDAYLNNVFVGIQSTINDILFYGLFGNYNNTAIAEISTGAGTQELLFFKGSSVSDRFRFQTTGNFVVETGVSARLFSTNTLTTLSNITPAFIINSSSNVGIQTASPQTPLDVAGIARAITLSSQVLNVSSINALNLSTPQGTVSSLFVNSLQIGDGTGWIGFGPIQSPAVSTIQGNANTNTTILTSTQILNVSSINGNPYKSFVIDHPINTQKYLVHACLEGPEVGVYYRGEGRIVDEKVSIYLPEYVDIFATDFTVQVTSIFESGEDAPQNLMVSRVSKGSFTVKGSPGSFFWHVYGKRGNLAVQPNKSDVSVLGQGPYKWILG